MKFQEIDFHIELFKAYLEPRGAQIDYLDMLRKETKFKRETFFIKLESAFNNIQTAYQNEVNKKRSFIQGMEENFNLSIPIQFFGSYPVLSNFSREFGYDHKINRETLEGLSYLLNSLRVIYLIKEKKKAISKKLEDLPKNQNETPKSESNPIKNKFNQMPMDEVRNHFKPLIEKENPKKVIWMTNEDFDIFLRRSFGMDKNLEKPKINLGHGAKYAIVKLFYQFYEKCQIEDYNQNRNKDPFLILLKDAFLTNEFDNLDASNFKPKSKKYEWN